LARLEEVRDGVAERAGPARRRCRRDPLRLGTLAQQIQRDAAKKIRRAGDRRVAGDDLRRHLAERLVHAVERRELAFVVEERADGRVHDLLTVLGAGARLGVEGEDGIVAGARGPRGNEKRHLYSQQSAVDRAPSRKDWVTKDRVKTPVEWALRRPCGMSKTRRFHRRG
jgi:hypothetical protein